MFNERKLRIFAKNKRFIHDFGGKPIGFPKPDRFIRIKSPKSWMKQINISVMTIKNIIFFATAIFCFVACDKRTSMLNDIQKMEKQLLANITNMDKVKAGNLIKKSQEFALAYPTDTVSARILFKAADVARGIGDFPNAMKMWNEIQANFPQTKYAAESLFLQGFTFENDLENKAKARECYLKFLNAYPNHDLIGDITMALKNIDTPLEDLVKQFEAKNKAEIEAEGK